MALGATFVARHHRAGRSLLAILHAIQDEAGYIPADVVAPLAQAMNLSRAEVYGVITYYHYFRTQPAPRVVVQLCRAESCRSMGSERLAAHIEARTGCRFDAHLHQGAAHLASAAAAGPGADVGLESVYCLGQCALSPNMMIGDKLVARVSEEKFDRLFAAASAGATAPGQPNPNSPPPGNPAQVTPLRPVNL
jgi:formate dehydrogenase subunit gamma